MDSKIVQHTTNHRNIQAYFKKTYNNRGLFGNVKNIQMYKSITEDCSAMILFIDSLTVFGAGIPSTLNTL